MPAALDEYQFELDGRYVFGVGRPLFVDEKGFDPGDANVVSQDSKNPLTGSTTFGRDVRNGQTWTFGLHVDGSDSDTAMAILDEAAGVWLGTADDLEENDVVPLRYCVGGRTRVVYGRPRKWAAPMDNAVINGLISPSATFDKADALHYGDEEVSVELRLLAPASGGFTAPFEAPILVDAGDGDVASQETIIVGGTARAGYIVEFYGPVQNPEVTIGDTVVGLTGVVPEGERYTVDTRPWAMTVKRKNGTSVAGILSSKTWLTRARVKPGKHIAAFRGSDTSGGARARVRLRPAFHSL